MHIGFSTGCFVQWNMSLDDVVKKISSYTTDAIEISFLTEKELFSFDPSEHFLDTIRKFITVSIHAPDKKHIVSEENMLIERLTDISKLLGTKRVVFHPDSFSKWDVLKENFEVLVENIPSDEYFGVSEVEKYGLNYVFDILHAFQVDDSYEKGREILKVMNGKIMEIHASGINQSQKHCMLIQSDKKELFESIIRDAHKISRGAVVILEGKIPPQDDASIKNELEYAKSIA